MGAAFANPQGGVVVGGSATITESGNKLDVHQHTDRAVIDWRSFDIDVDEHTQFHQPSSSSLAVNRVNSSDRSNIMGRLSANGNIVIINQNGVLFGANSRVDVNSLVATTADITNEDAMAGNLRFNTPGNPNASIVNEGLITAKEAGLVGFVAPSVLNHGIINARLGRVELASGDTFTIDLYGDGLYEIAISDEVAGQLVSNTGDITAEGGVIALTAAAAREIVDSLITIQGSLKATSVEEKNGTIILSAGGSNAVDGNVAEDKGKKEGESTILIANAHLDVSGRNEGEQGGSIEITADNIGILENTIIDASGHSAPSPVLRESATMTADKEVRTEEEFWVHGNRAGGSIKIGGDYLGTGDTAAAKYVYVDPYSVILNDAIESGDGGRTIVWSDVNTYYYGNVYARGGLQGGHGGFLETSGKQYLDAKGYADLTFRYEGYNKGTYLLDPANITIYGNETSVFNSSDLVGYWDFEEGTGTATNDESTNSNNGALIGGATWTGSGAPTPQHNTNSVTLDGSSGYINIANTPLLLGDLTISVWVKPDNINSNAYISDFAGVDEFSLIHGYQNGHYNAYGFGYPIGNNPTNSQIAASGSSSWDLVTWVKNGTNLKGYINGVELSDGTITHADLTPDNSGLRIGTYYSLNFSQAFDGQIDDYRIYNSALSANNIAELSGSRFTVEGIELMSQTADVVMQADNTITLDLQGDTLTMDDDRSITLQTTNGDIRTDSSGTIVTNRTTTGGNISFTAGGSGDIVIDHALTLNAQNGGQVTLTASGDDITVSDNLNITTDNFTYTGTLGGSGNAFTYQQGTTSNSLGIGTGGSPDTSISDAVISAIKTVFSSYSFGRSDGGDITNYIASWEDPVTFLSSGNFTNAADTSSDDTILVDVGGDVILNQDMATTSATANALVLSAGDDFTNTAGSDALEANNSRWLLYSDAPTGNTRDGLLPSTTEFNKNYASNAPGTIAGSDNRFIYNTATAPTLVYQVGNDTVEYGEAYGGTPSVSYSSGLLAGDSLATIGLSGSAGILSSYNAGDNAGVNSGVLGGATGSLSNALGYNYAFIAGDLTVTKAALTVTANDASRSYGDANPSFTGSISGFKLTDDVNDLGTAPTYSTAATQSSNVGSYSISASGGVDSNYNFSYVDGSLNISKATLTAALLDDSPSRQAGLANPEFEISYSGFKLSDTAASLDIAPLATTLATIGSAAGSYDITLGGGSDANYTISYTNPAGTLTVTPAPVTTLPGSVLNADRNAAQTVQSIVANFFEPIFTPKRIARSKAPKQQKTDFSQVPSTQANPQQPNTLKQPTQLAKSSSTSQPVPYYPELANVMPGGPPMRTEAAPRMTMFDGLVEVTPEVVAFFGLDRLSDEQFEKLGMGYMDDNEDEEANTR